jgi:hypothetical protein
MGPPPNGALCLSTPKHNGKSGTDDGPQASWCSSKQTSWPSHRMLSSWYSWKIAHFWVKHPLSHSKIFLLHIDWLKSILKMILTKLQTTVLRRVWRYQWGNQNRKSKKDRQHNGQELKDKETNNDLQNITHRTKDPVTRTPLKTEAELRSSRRVCSSCSTNK